MNRQSQAHLYAWNRYWIPQGQDPVMQNGYFVEPALNEVFWVSSRSDGVPLSALRDVPCLVLLGDMGMGKSTVVWEEARELSKALVEKNHEIVFRDLRRLSEPQIYRQVFSDPKVEGWKQGSHALTLILDSLDECWRRIDELESILVGEIERCLKEKKERNEEPQLFLRLTCRAAEWRGHVGDALRRLFSTYEKAENPVRVYTLAPLSQSNIRQAAESEACDPDDLLQRIAEREVQPLASHPITFDMLFQVYRQGGELPGSRVELYERGCLGLCADPQSVPGSNCQRATNPHERLAIASRLAALSVLTNRYHVNANTEHALARSDVLEAASAFGYFEEEARGERVEVNRTTTSDALSTALFGESVDGLQTWRHQSYAEFLGARYLARRGLSAGQIVALITDTTDNAGRLIPQLEETGRWVAEMVPPGFDLLAGCNAEVFIRCDPKNLNDKKREILVSGYLDLIRRHETPELDWQLKNRLARLSHPGLGDQLSGVIANRREDPLVRESAIDIAGCCKCDSVALKLTDVFLDPGDVFRVRQRAAIALEQMASETVRNLLKLRARDNNIDDPMDELKGHYLRILWPSHLSLAELLVLLTPPKRQSFTGSYRMFLFDLAKSLPDSDLPRMLQWMRTKGITFDIHSSFSHFPVKIAVRALQQMHEPKIRDAVVGLIRNSGGRVEGLFEAAAQDLDLSASARQHFWLAMVEAGIDLRELVRFGGVREARILQPEDLSFIATQYLAAARVDHRACWLDLLFWVFDPANAAALDALSGIANADPLIAAKLAAYTSCPLVPEEENLLKKEFERTRKAQAGATARPEPSFSDLIEAHLRAFELGEPQAFSWVVEALQMDPDKQHGIFFPTIRLAGEKAWQSLQPELKQRVLAAAPRYLEAQPVMEEEVWDEQHHYRTYDAVAPLLVLLFDEARSLLVALPPSLWRKWAPVLFTYHDRQNGSHEEACALIFSLAFTKAQAESLASLKRFLGRQINHDQKRRLVWDLGAVWNPGIKQILTEIIREKPLKPSAGQDLFQLLYSHEPRETVALLRQILDQRNDPGACSILTPAAGAVLLTVAPKERGSELIDLLSTDPALGDSISWCLLRGTGQQANWLSRLPAKSTAEFWHWLDTRFPPDPYLANDGVGDVTPAHQMHLFRLAVLQSLVSRSTPEACGAMVWLMRQRPGDFWLGDLLAAMRKAARGTLWQRPDPATLMKSFAHVDKRLVRTSGDLHALLVESTRRFEKMLQGSPPSLELWNEITKGRKKIWEPKDELNLSNCLKRHFERDLDQSGIIASREVQVRQRLGSDPAQLVDILVHAVPFNEDGKPGKRVTVVVEVKCAWNTGVLEDMDRQLYGRYLASSEFERGVYIVAYFTCKAWNRTKDSRKLSGASSMDIRDLEAKLHAQAKALSSCERRVDALVIDARIGIQSAAG